MAKVSVSASKTFNITLEGLSEYQVKFLASVFQNSPLGYHLCDEPVEEGVLRKAIFEQCKQALNG